MMDSEELNSRIKHFIERLDNPTIRSMKDVMNFLSDQYAGQYDGKMASIITKNILLS